MVDGDTAMGDVGAGGEEGVGDGASEGGGAAGGEGRKASEVVSRSCSGAWLALSALCFTPRFCYDRGRSAFLSKKNPRWRGPSADDLFDSQCTKSYMFPSTDEE